MKGTIFGERARYMAAGAPPALNRLLGASPAAALATVFFLSFGGAAAMSVVSGIPLPAAHDEHSYLLAADTYARGRITNEPHPHWEHFESPHVLQRPTYASKFQPGQGLMLAAGQRLGHPIVGVWLSTALMCAAMTWMLMGWLPYRWSILGGILAMLEFGLAGVWAQSYWGGAVACAGGALLFGAYRRLDRKSAWAPAALLGLGALILAFSRPFEGLVVFLIVMGSLIVRRVRGAGGHGLGRALFCVAATGAMGIALLTAFNEAVTGDPLTMPYQHHSRLYDAAPLFVFQPPPPQQEYRHNMLERFHAEWELDNYEARRTLGGWLTGALARPPVALLHYSFGPPRRDLSGKLWLPGALLLPMLLIPHLSRRRLSRYAFFVVILFFLTLSAATYFVSHYVAVVAGVWMFLVVESIRVLRALMRGRLLGRAIVPLILVYSGVLAVLSAFEQRAYASEEQWFVQRDSIERGLVARGGRHLVLVAYSSDYYIHHEWVYNSAEIDGQDVVWARTVDLAQDKELVDYYAGRLAWRLRLRQGAQPHLEAYQNDSAAGP